MAVDAARGGGGGLACTREGGGGGALALTMVVNSWGRVVEKEGEKLLAACQLLLLPPFQPRLSPHVFSIFSLRFLPSLPPS